MKTRLTLLLIVGLLLPTGAVASANRTAERPAAQLPQRYYLALGDSIAYGIQPTKASAVDRPAAFPGYVAPFAAQLRKLSPKLQVVNYGCPGESTTTFAHGRCPSLADGVRLLRERLSPM